MVRLGDSQDCSGTVRTRAARETVRALVALNYHHDTWVLDEAMMFGSDLYVKN
jgi:hypothetical protein